MQPRGLTDTDATQWLREGEMLGAHYILTIPHRALHGAAGQQAGRRSGISLDFNEFREYQPGDDPRSVDWSAFARSDKLMVKLYREEVNPHLDLLLDASRSMAFADETKACATLYTAAALAMAAVNSRCTHQSWMLRQGFEPVLRGTERPSLWRQLRFDSPLHPADIFARFPPVCKRHGIRILISDLFWLDDPLALLRRLSQNAASVVVIQLLTQADKAPPASGQTRLIDVETDEIRDLYIDESAVQRYRHALHQHQQYWTEACRQTGAVKVDLVAEEVLRDRRLHALEKLAILETA